MFLLHSGFELKAVEDDVDTADEIHLFSVLYCSVLKC